MSKPKDGMVIESTPAADLGDVWLYRACKVIEAWDCIPRELVTGSEQAFVAQRLDLIRQHNLTSTVDHEYDPDEWSLNNLKEGHERVTYWSPGACETIVNWEGVFYEFMEISEPAVSERSGKHGVTGRF